MHILSSNYVLKFTKNTFLSIFVHIFTQTDEFKFHVFTANIGINKKNLKKIKNKTSID